LLVSGVLFTSCLGKYVESDTAKLALEEETKILQYGQSNALTLTKESHGVYYQLSKTNSAGLVASGAYEFYIAYSIKTLSGVEIASKSAKDSVILNVYGTQAFQGFLYSLAILKEGEKGKFFIPSSMAYGANPPLAADGSSTVEKNAIIVVELEVIDMMTEDERIDSYIKKKGLTVTEKTSSGLRFIRLNAPTKSDTLKQADNLSIKYTGMYLNDKSFDSGTLNYSVGSTNLIQGFIQGIMKLKKGEKARVVFPSAIGYGPNGNTSIPPYTPLVFDIEIVTVNGV
jgi:FKBP-type peptidyl-prolyl cis-trans isomerase